MSPRPSTAWLGRRPRQKIPPAPASDATLFTAVAAGDQDALYELFCRHSPEVHAVARLACGQVGAERVLRDVFLDIWEAQSRCEGTSGWPTSRVDLLTRAAQGGAVAPDDVESPPPPPFDALPTPVSEVLALLVFGGCSFLETAALLDVPETLVRHLATKGFVALARSARAADQAGPDGS